MGVTLDMRTVRSGKEIVDKVMAHDPTYHAYEVTERTNAFLRAWNKHYIGRRSRKHNATEDERRARAANEGIAVHNIALRSQAAPAPRPKVRRGVTFK